MILARVGRNTALILDNTEGLDPLVVEDASGPVAASPRASTSTPISADTSLSSIGVDATQIPSRQWLNTTFRWSGCLVTLNIAP
jgi:hypothetical protein